MESDFGRRQRKSAGVNSPLFQDLGEAIEISQTLRQRIRVLTIDPHLRFGVSHRRLRQDHGFREAGFHDLRRELQSVLEKKFCRKYKSLTIFYISEGLNCPAYL